MKHEGVAQPTVPGEANLGHATEVSHVHGLFGQTCGWALAAPHAECNTSEQAAEHASQSETAASFFDMVFLSVALVAYTPVMPGQGVTPRTSTQKSSAGMARFSLHEHGSAPESHRSPVSASVRFPGANAETASLAQHLLLGSLNASSCVQLNASQRSSAGPLQLPFISIRAWTSYYG